VELSCLGKEVVAEREGEGGQVSEEIRRRFGCAEVLLEQVGTVDDDSYFC
jgi:hypothetical protein